MGVWASQSHILCLRNGLWSCLQMNLAESAHVCSHPDKWCSINSLGSFTRNSYGRWRGSSHQVDLLELTSSRPVKEKTLIHSSVSKSENHESATKFHQHFRCKRNPDLHRNNKCLYTWLHALIFSDFRCSGSWRVFFPPCKKINKQNKRWVIYIKIKPAPEMQVA